MIFYSPTNGTLNEEETIKKIIEFMNDDKFSRYRVSIGTDSNVVSGTKIKFISVILIHRMGKYARYYYTMHNITKYMVLSDRMFQEAIYTLEVVDNILEKLEKNIPYDIIIDKIEIHADIGNKGKSKEYLSGVLGFLKGSVNSNYSVLPKPDSIAASNVADYLCRNVDN
jgi:predicted RNase H-related nuclease YkuK (DUF458 family)